MNLYTIGYKTTKPIDNFSDEEKAKIEEHSSKLVSHIKAESFEEASKKAFKTQLKDLIVVNKVEVVAEGVVLG